jgi:acetyl-CoA carboxylase carboxyltransferase component
MSGTGRTMTWEPELNELRRREELAENLGGPEKVERQHHFGKQTVRERIDAIVDKGSFWELGKTAGVASYDDEGNLVDLLPSNFVFGLAELDGRPAVVSGDDFTVRGGSNDASISAKREGSESVALEMRLPHVRLLDGMSGGGSVKTIEMAGRTYIPLLPGWHTVIDHLNVAPSVSLVLGSVAGFGAARATTCHYSIMVAETSQMMIAGPALVEQAGLGSVSKEELGHARIHTANGAIDDVVHSEQEAFDRALHFLSYLPGNVDELPPIEDWGDDPGRRDPWLLSAVPREPRQAYDMRAIIEAVVDAAPGVEGDEAGGDRHSSFFEIGRSWGTSIISGLARIDGVPVAVYAEDPSIYGGGWTADPASDDPLRGLPRLCHRQDLGGGGHHPGRLNRPGSSTPIDGALLHRADSQGLRGGGGVESKTGFDVDAYGLAIGRLGFAAARRWT